MTARPNAIQDSTVKRKRAGIFLIAIGLAANEPLIARVLSPDGEFESKFIGFSILTAQIIIVLAGLALLTTWRPMLHPAAQNALLLAASTGFGVYAGEAAMRFAPGIRFSWPAPATHEGEFENRPSRNFIADSLIGWRMSPSHSFDGVIDGERSTYRSDSSGFRVGAESNAGARSKVVLVGDSFTFGIGVQYEQTFGALLEARLSGVDIDNLALPGFATDQMMLTTIHYGLERDPDLVVVGFVDQDLDRNFQAYRHAEGFNKPVFTAREGRPVPRPQRPRNGVIGWLERNSGLWNLGRIVSREVSFRYARGKWWSLSTAIFGETQRLVRANGAVPLFVRLPEKKPRAFPALRREMERSGMLYVDLGRPGVAPAGLHFETDSHINAAGHAFVADTLVSVIRTLLNDARISRPPADSSDHSVRSAAIGSMRNTRFAGR